MLAILVVTLVGNQLVGLITFHNTTHLDGIHHIRQSIQNLMSPCKSGGEIDMANADCVTQRHFLHHAVDVQIPSGKFFLGLVKNGVVGHAKGLSAVLADESLVAVAMPILDDVERTAERTNYSGVLFGNEFFNRFSGDGPIRIGSIGVFCSPCQKCAPLGFIKAQKEVVKICKLLCIEFHGFLFNGGYKVAKASQNVKRKS